MIEDTDDKGLVVKEQVNSQYPDRGVCWSKTYEAEADKYLIIVEYIIADVWKMNNNPGGLVLLIFSNLFQYQLFKKLNWS